MIDEPSFATNLVETIYQLISHNYEVLAYFSVLCLAILYAVKQPTRANVIMVIGLALLVFNFEFEKHISEGLRAQTEQSLTQGASLPKVRSFTKLLFEFIIPVGSYFAGWALLVISFVLTHSHHGTKKT
jgi:hypothetical protein